MDRKPLHLICIYELDNAAAVGNPSSLGESFDSLLRAAKRAQGSPISLELQIVGPESMNLSHGSVLKEKIRSHGNLEVAFRASQGGYFSSKVPHPVPEPASYIVFTDSDCTYEEDYFLKLAHTIMDHPDAVIYGLTYGQTPRNPFQTISQYCWQFPPVSLGYGQSFPRSNWANNMVIPAKVLLHAPFPEIRLHGVHHFETKQERFLWHSQRESEGIKIVQSQAICHHEQVVSLWAWIVRHWEHGKSRGLKIKARPLTPRARFKLAFRTGSPARWQQLRELFRLKKLTRSELWAATSLLALGFFLRIGGQITILSTSARWEVLWADARGSVTGQETRLTNLSTTNL